MWEGHDAGLIGRDQELAAIAAAFADGCGVALVGPAGVGKSRLADAGRRLAESSDLAVVAAIATPSSQHMPLGALAHLLPPAGAIGDLNDALQPTRLLQTMRQALVDAAGDRRIVLCVDDAHLLDPLSAHLVGHLSRLGVLLPVLTVRTGEAAPEPVTSLWKDDVVRRVDIGPFDEPTTSTLAAAALGGPLDPVATRWLFRTSAGNALYARELARGAADSGALTWRGSSWSLAADRPTISPRLTDLVGLRLEGLSTQARRVLELVASAEPIGLDLAQASSSEQALAELDDRGLLHVVMGGRRVELRPAHPLYGEALRQQPLTLRRRSDLIGLAAAIEAHGSRRRDDPVRLAMLRLAAHEPVDPEVLLRAAVAAQQGTDDHTAVRLADLGLQQGSTDHEVITGLRMCAATSLARLGEFLEADRLFALVAEAETDETSRVELAVRRAFTRSEGADDVDGAAAILREAIDSASSLNARRMRFDLVTLLADAGRAGEAAALMNDVDALEPDDDVTTIVAANLARTASLTASGRWGAARTAAVAGYEHHIAHPEADSSFHPLSQIIYRITALQHGGWTVDALAECDDMLRDDEMVKRPIGSCIARLISAQLRLQLGHVDDAERLAIAALDGWTPSMQPFLRRWACASLSLVAAARDDGAAATLWAERMVADAAGPRLRMAAGRGAVEIGLAPARAQVVNDRRSAGRNLLEQSLAAADADDDPATALWLRLHHCIEFRRATMARRLRATCAQTDPAAPIVGCALTVAAATEADTHGRWAEAAEAFEAIGHRLTAAQLWRVAADTAATAGHSRSATAHRLRSTEALEGCTGLQPGPGPRLGLTDREREIARLVAGGASSKEVAGQLVVSVRTVDNHLQRIYAKLGISTRRDLAAALRNI